MITKDATKTVTVKIPSVFTYSDNDFKDADGNPVEYRIDLTTAKDPDALATRGLLYGWGRALNDAKGSSESKTEDERRKSQLKRFEAIMSNTWTVGGGGGAKVDPVLVEVRAIIVIKTKKPLSKVAKRFKSLDDIRKAYGDTITDLWVAAAKDTIAARESLGNADDDLPDVF